MELVAVLLSPLLIDLPSLYFHHYALLVFALHILLQDCLSNAHVDLQLTLQLLHPILQQRESPEALDFLTTINGSIPKRGMQVRSTLILWEV